VRISKRVASLTASATLAISAKAKAMKAAGRSVIDFGAGEPDFPTPKHICEAAKRAIDEGFTRYCPASGMPELRAGIAARFKADCSLEYAPSEVLVSVGGKEAIYNVVQALVDDGDEVVIPAPYWLSYPEMVRAAGGVPVGVEAGPASDFKITPRQLAGAITEKTALFIFNSPCNPTGAVYSPDEVRALFKVIEERSIPAISDEMYDKLVYGGTRCLSPASISPRLKELVFTSNGVSKTYAMTGWRVGYIAGPRDAIEAAGSLQSHSTSGTCSIAQKAALAALAGPQESVERMRLEFDRRRLRMLERLNAIPGVRCPEPKGAFYCFPDVSDRFGGSVGGRNVADSVSFCAAALDLAEVALVPGEPFGGANHVRLSYSTSMENIEEGLARLARLMR